MAQVTKFTIDPNLSGIQLRTQASEMLTALSTLNSGYLEPVNPSAGMLWLDTTKNILKIRNKTNTAWLDFASISDRAVIGSASALTGMIIASASVNIPEGFLLCDGSAISISTYINLYNAIGNAYGNGNGSTTFNIPDLRGEFIRGVDNGRGVDAGRQIGSNQSDAMRNLTGTYYGALDGEGGYSAFCTGGATGVFMGGGAITQIRNASSYEMKQINGKNGFIFDASRQVPIASEFRPRNVSVNFYIKY
nr:MAG TPA: tail fiber protein [Caudoviricetes sp.]